jgi:hypothetical protein
VTFFVALRKTPNARFFALARTRSRLICVSPYTACFDGLFRRRDETPRSGLPRSSRSPSQPHRRPRPRSQRLIDLRARTTQNGGQPTPRFVTPFSLPVRLVRRYSRRSDRKLIFLHLISLASPLQTLRPRHLCLHYRRLLIRQRPIHLAPSLLPSRRLLRRRRTAPRRLPSLLPQR